MPVCLFTLPPMPRQALLQTAQGAARIDVTPCGEKKRPQLPDPKPHCFGKMQMQLIDTSLVSRQLQQPPASKDRRAWAYLFNASAPDSFFRDLRYSEPYTTNTDHRRSASGKNKTLANS